MLDYFRSLFWPDEDRRNQTEKDKQVRKLEMDEPMAGAGAQISGEHNKTETEKNLERATRHSKKDGDF
jgi:hypothetical protein